MSKVDGVFMRNILLTGLDAALILAIGMGFGRFAFTAIYPYMVAEQILSVQTGSFAASVNYIGYLAGALLAVRFRMEHAHKVCIVALIGTTFCLGMHALPLPDSGFIALRGLAGIFSALAIIGASQWLLGQKGLFKVAPLLYAGVGLGIALSAELVVLGSAWQWNSHQLWLMLAAVSLCISLTVIPQLRTPDLSSNPRKTPLASTPIDLRTRPLIILYGLAGFGYIITATYLPLLVKLVLPDLSVGHLWAIFGLGAVPSCFVWHAVQQRCRSEHALMFNLSLQAVGVALPVLLPNATGYLFSALLVGATFMGTVTLVMPLAQRIAQNTSTNLIAVLTVAYSIGQIVGPLVANEFYRHTHNFDYSLLSASVALLLAAAFSFTLTSTER